MGCIAFCFETAPAQAGAVSSLWWQVWLGPAAIVMSAVAAGFYAFFTNRANQAMARKQATLALIERSKSTDYYQNLATSFLEIRRDEAGFEQIKSPTNPQVQEQRRNVLEYLNHYELIAVGIAQGALDKELYKAYRQRTVVRDWKAAAEFVAHIRNPTPDSGSKLSSGGAFSALQALAEEWEKDLPALPSDRVSRKK